MTGESGAPTRSADSADAPLLLDVMLGKLAVYLRMCGYDAVYALDREVEADDRLLALAEAEGRRLLTRDVQLARRANGGVLLESCAVVGQLRELRDAGFDLTLDERPARCGRCNGPVERVDGDDETPEYAPDPDERAVFRCTRCGQCFWKGSHWDDVEETLAAV
ncbi:Mut7-C RNAse domain-containing protein [Haloprofundus salinisoli]|uniref:Mut7-C RNAse domain-containing protein n=1 Tax=Haloprofundus salinisoli TaxID=2876193 RepID=UPI001CCB093D|nr:Mut7-C RNAse domain-containing protein [Haloprofundus salinisoli]